MTRFVVDCGVVLHLARRVVAVVPTAPVEALRTSRT
jgi:hypothetical protein